MLVGQSLYRQNVVYGGFQRTCRLLAVAETSLSAARHYPGRRRGRHSGDRLWPLPLCGLVLLAVVGLVLWATLHLLERQLHCRPFCEQPGDGSTSAAPIASHAECHRQPWHCLFQAVAHRREKGALVVGNVLLLVAVAATAGAWRHCCWNLFPADDLGRYAGEKSTPGLCRGDRGRIAAGVDAKTVSIRCGTVGKRGLAADGRSCLASQRRRRGSRHRGGRRS